MDKPVCAGTQPVVGELEPGVYWWCRCGRSKKQPWCDGSHKGTSFSPMEVEITEKRVHAMCVCKQTGSAPFCDGSHKRLPPE